MAAKLRAVSSQLAFEFNTFERPAKPLALPPPPLTEEPEVPEPSLPVPLRSLTSEEPENTAFTRTTLERQLNSSLRQRVRVVVTDNRRRMLSTRRRPGGLLEVRLHRLFLNSDETVYEALISYLRERSKSAIVTLRAHIRAQNDQIRKPKRKVRLRTRGAFHDLGNIMNEVTRDYFEGLQELPYITWGRASGRSRAQRSIRLGSYCTEQKLIRIHPRLDQAFVPRYFVAFVVFHELLHHVVPPEKTTSGIRFHTPRFRALERAHPEYNRACKWEKDHIEDLLGHR